MAAAETVIPVMSRWLVSLECGCFPWIDLDLPVSAYPGAYEQCPEHGRQLVFGFTYELADHA